MSRAFLERVRRLDALEFAPDEALRQRLERHNEIVARRLRERIARGRFTRAGLRRAFARLAIGASGFDALDVLVALLLGLDAADDESVPRSAEMVAYQPTPARDVLELVERAGLGPGDAFVDLGSGLGHVAILVALLTGARVRGVELQPAHVARARRSAEALGLDADFVAGDARTAALAGGTVYFLFTPFRGELLRAVLERLERESSLRAVATLGPCTREVAQAPWLVAGGPLDPDRVAIFRRRRSLAF